MSDPVEVMKSLIVSFTLCDHLGDAWDDVLQAAKLIGVDIGENENGEDAAKRFEDAGVVGIWSRKD